MSKKSTIFFLTDLSVPFEYEFTPRGNQAPYIHVIGTNSSYTYDYDVSVSTGETFSNQTGDVTIYFTDNNPRTLAISGVFPSYNVSAISQSYASFAGPVIWGDQKWESMEETFLQASNMSTFASDTPDLSLAPSFYKFFKSANISVANNLGDWDVSNVTIMAECFRSANLTNIDITNWNVSNVTSFRYMFTYAAGLGSTSPTDLTGWDVSSGNMFGQMFRNDTSFNQDISGWDMGSATSLQSMFLDASSFNQPIGNWNTATFTSIRGMLTNASAFDQDLSNWNISNITDGIDFLSNTGLSTANYDSTLISWAAQNPTNNITIDFGSSQYTPGGAAETARTSLINSGWTVIDGGAAPVPFTLRIDTTLGNGFDSFVLPMVSGTYDVDWGDGNIDLAQSGTKTHNYLTSGIYDVAVTGGVTLQLGGGGDYLKATNLLKWGESQWTSASGMFLGCQNMVITATDIPDWSSCTTLYRMFRSTPITNVPNIEQWDVSNVSNIGDLFYDAVDFNQNIGNWDVSNVASMGSVFRFSTSFNQPIGSWDVSSVTDMRLLFRSVPSFNQPIGDWDVSNVTNMNDMFVGATAFNQDISNWQISQVTILGSFMTGVTLSTVNYDALLIAWDAQGAMSYSGTVNFGSSQYTLGGAAEAARTSLIAKWGAIIDGGGIVAPFTISVKTDNAGTSNNDQFTIPWTGTYDVDWGDGNTDTSVVDAQTHTYATAGTYDVSVTAASGQIAFANTGDKAKLLDISSWGGCTWTSAYLMFYGCSNLATISATDSPDLSGVTQLVSMFRNCTTLECDINHWDVSSLSGSGLYYTFANCRLFNSALNNWDVSGVGGLYGTFDGCTNFNQPLNNAWNKSWGGNFYRTFQGANINQDLSGWDMSNVTGMYSSFAWSENNSDISSWDVSSVTFMGGMFLYNRHFNQDISSWDVSSVTNVQQMFNYATAFDQDISSWQVSQVTFFQSFMTGITLSIANYDALLIGWDSQGAMSYSGTVDFGNSQYTLGGAAEAARTSLIAKWGAIIDGGGIAAPPVPFTISVNTNNVGTSNSNQFQLDWQTTLSTIDYSVDWGDGSSDLNITNNATLLHTYASSGIYTVKISGQSVGLNGAGDVKKIIDIIKWGDFQWNGSFSLGGAPIADWTATDIPNLSNLNGTNSFGGAFANNPLSTADFTNWDVSSVTDFVNVFYNCDSFQGDGLSTWQITQATRLLLLTAATGATTANYDSMLVAYEAQLQVAYPNGVGYPNAPTFNMGGSQYTPGGAAEAAKTSLVNTYGWTIVDGGAVPVTGLLADYPNAIAGYSLRSLVSTSTNVIRVRRSNDQAEQDFTAAEITDGTLTTWTGANDGFVPIWYNQATGSSDLFTTTALNQPSIVQNGVLNLDNGKPYLAYNTITGHRLSTDRFTDTIVPFDAFMTFNGSTANRHCMLGGASSTQYIGTMINSSALDTYSNVGAIPVIRHNGIAMSVISEPSMWNTFVTNSDELATISLAASSMYYIRPFSYHYSSWWNGISKMKEIVFYPQSVGISKSGVENNINTEYTIY